MPMQEQTLVEAIMFTRAQIDFIWQFFVTVQIAIFALLLIYDEAVEGLSIVARVLAITGIALFDWINGNALLNAYNLLDAMHQQYRADFGQIDRFQTAFYEMFVRASYAGREKLLMTTHGLAFAVVLLALLWRKFIQRGAARAARRNNAEA